VSVAVPLRLASVGVASFVPIAMDEANALLVDFGHYLGPCNRPFRSEGWALDILGEPVAVAVTSSTVSETAAGYPRAELVELSRLAARERWATRVMLRLWREVAARRYLSWTPSAAVAYSQNDRHEGRIYRFDGWEKITERAGTSGGGGAWTRPRYATDAAHGSKTLWIWRYTKDAA
jgi:hypothetical protein